MSNNTDQTAVDTVEQCLKEYGIHTLSYQLPQLVDGLKPSHRRILWCVREMSADDKAAVLIGAVAQLHPHGDRSIGDSIVRLSQEFSMFSPMIVCECNNGNYAGESPAGARYLEVRRAPLMMDLFFNYVNQKTLEFVRSELGSKMEPKLLVPVLPTALLMSTFGISLGFQCNILPFSYHAVGKMAGAYVAARINGTSVQNTFAAHPEWFYPDSHVPSLLRNSKKIRRAVSSGQLINTAVYDGTMKICSDSITVYTLPPGVLPGNIYERMRETIVRDKKHPLNAKIQDISNPAKDLLHLTFHLKKKVSPFEVLDQIKQMVGFTRTEHPHMVMMDDRLRVRPDVGVQDILDEWYHARRQSVLGDIKYRMIALSERHRSLTAQCYVAEYSDEVISIIRNAGNREEAIVSLCRRFTKLTRKQANDLMRLQLAQLNKMDAGELEKKRQDTEQELREVNETQTKIGNIILSIIRDIDSKYKIPRKAMLPDFKGVAKFPDGIVQYSTDEERHRLLLDFGEENVELIQYPSGGVNRIAVIGDNIVTDEWLDHPKEMSVDDWIVSRRKLTQTIVIRDGRIYRLAGLHNRMDDPGSYNYVANKFTAISNKGEVTTETTVNTVLRKSVTAGGVLTNCCHASPCFDNDLVVAYGCPKSPNTVKLTRLPGFGQLQKNPLGELVVLGVYRAEDKFIVNIPASIRRRNKIAHLYVETANQMLEMNKTVTLELGKKDKSTKGLTVQRGSHGLFELKKID